MRSSSARAANTKQILCQRVGRRSRGPIHSVCATTVAQQLAREEFRRVDELLFATFNALDR
ncbi:MAG: hypothetical protein ABSH51_29220 [Solirubrobacteraceae bacterium]|jgi:hypothetical protein